METCIIKLTASQPTREAQVTLTQRVGGHGTLPNTCLASATDLQHSGKNLTRICLLRVLYQLFTYRVARRPSLMEVPHKQESLWEQRWTPAVMVGAWIEIPSNLDVCCLIYPTIFTIEKLTSRLCYSDDVYRPVTGRRSDLCGTYSSQCIGYVLIKCSV